MQERKLTAYEARRAASLLNDSADYTVAGCLSTMAEHQFAVEKRAKVRPAANRCDAIVPVSDG